MLHPQSILKPLKNKFCSFFRASASPPCRLQTHQPHLGRLASFRARVSIGHLYQLLCICGSWTLQAHHHRSGVEGPWGAHCQLLSFASSVVQLLCVVQNAFSTDLSMRTDSKVGFTRCVLKLSLFLHLHILPEVWVRVSDSFSWDWNQALRFLFSVKFMFCLLPCSHPRAGDLWLGRKCLSKQCCPVTLPAQWCSKPASFLSTEEGVWWDGEGMQDFTLMRTQKRQEFWERALISDPLGTMTSAEIQELQRTM